MKSHLAKHFGRDWLFIPRWFAIDFRNSKKCNQSHRQPTFGLPDGFGWCTRPGQAVDPVRPALNKSRWLKPNKSQGLEVLPFQWQPSGNILNTSNSPKSDLTFHEDPRLVETSGSIIVVLTTPDCFRNKDFTKDNQYVYIYIIIMYNLCIYIYIYRCSCLFMIS